MNRRSLFTRLFYSASILLGFALLSASGCDRGSRPTLVGRVAPDFTVQDAQRTIALHDLRGKIVVLNFWATWCPPCVEEMPSLQALQQLPQMQGRVVVFAVSQDDDADAYQKFLRDHSITFLTVRDATKKSSDIYGSTGYPETYIVDARGVIRRKFIGPVDWTKPEIVEFLSKI